MNGGKDHRKFPVYGKMVNRCVCEETRKETRQDKGETGENLRRAKTKASEALAS